VKKLTRVANLIQLSCLTSFIAPCAPMSRALTVGRYCNYANARTLVACYVARYRCRRLLR